MRRFFQHFCVFAWAVALPGAAVAAAAAQALEVPEAAEQLELDGGWSAETIVDVGNGGEVQLFGAVGRDAAIGFEVESEGTRVEGFGIAALVGLADDVGLQVQLDADMRGRPSEAAVVLIAEGGRGVWSATANLALRRGFRGELSGHSIDYAWRLRAAMTRALAVGVEGAGRVTASATRRAGGLRGHFVGFGLSLAPRARGPVEPEFTISLLREARLAKAPAVLRVAIQIDLARQTSAHQQAGDAS